MLQTFFTVLILCWKVKNLISIFAVSTSSDEVVNRLTGIDLQLTFDGVTPTNCAHPMKCVESIKGVNIVINIVSNVI